MTFSCLRHFYYKHAVTHDSIGDTGLRSAYLRWLHTWAWWASRRTGRRPPVRAPPTRGLGFAARARTDAGPSGRAPWSARSPAEASSRGDGAATQICIFFFFGAVYSDNLCFEFTLSTLTSSWTPPLVVNLLPSVMAMMIAGSRKKGFLPYQDEETKAFQAHEKVQCLFQLILMER